MTRFVGVLGAGRCGSSAVAGLLHAAGVFVGHNLIGPHPRWNAKGHFEDRDLHRLNRLMAYRFAPAGVENETVQRYPELREHDQADHATLLAQYRQVVDARRNRPLWAMKCIMLGVIWPHIAPLLPTDRRLILVERDRDATIGSRMAHSDLAHDAAAALVDHLAQAARNTVASATCPVLVVRYEVLCEQPQTEVRRILDFVRDGLALTLNVPAAIATIEPEMNHAQHHATIDV
jgi:hypothetical protein